jgi:hypothetical protein
MIKTNYDMRLGELLKLLDGHGWKEGIGRLEALHKLLEEKQAWLYGGDPDQVNNASKMSPMLARQDETLIRLHIIAKERGIEL